VHATPPAEPSEFNATHYPRDYSMGGGYRALYVVLGLVIALGSTLLMYFVALHGSGPHAGRLLASGLFLIFFLFGLYLMASAVRYHVTLDADSVEVTGAIRHRLVLRRDIKGIRRRIVRGSPASWIVVVNDGVGRNLQLSQSLKTDRDFTAWIRSFPDLDREAEEAAAREAAEAARILEARGVGVGAQRTLRQLATVLSTGSYALLFLLLLVPRWQPVLIWLAIAWPLVTIALVAYFQPLFRFGGSKGKALPDLSMGLFFPGLALTLLVLNALHTLHWWTPLIAAVSGSVILVGLAWWADPWLRRQRWAAPALGLLCCAYGYGAGLELDARLDASTPTFYPVRVLSMHINRGKSTSYHVEVSPWGPIEDADDITVPRNRYAGTRVGDTLCTSLHQGALAIPWYVLGDCPASER
jgi:hypothetical protein